MKAMFGKIVAAFCAILLTVSVSMAQAGFSYQATLRNSDGNLVCNQKVGMRFSLLYNNKTYYTESQTPTSNAYGTVSVIVGEGTCLNGSFDSVPWYSMAVMMKIEVDVNGGTNYTELGTIQIQGAPYAMYAKTAGMSREIVADANAGDDDILFAVKDSDGNLVFAVYPSGVRVFVDDSNSKAAKRGFAVSSNRATKDGGVEDLFVVDGQGTQVFVDDTDAKAAKRGFAVSSNRATKAGVSENIFVVNGQGTQVFVDDSDTKAAKRGFAVSSNRATKDGDVDYLSIGNDSVKFASSSFTVADSKSETEVLAVEAGRVNVKSDMFLDGGIGIKADNGDVETYYVNLVVNGTMSIAYKSFVTTGGDTIWVDYSTDMYSVGADGTLYSVGVGYDRGQILYFDENTGALSGAKTNLYIINDDARVIVNAEDIQKDVVIKFAVSTGIWDEQEYEYKSINVVFTAKCQAPVKSFKATYSLFDTDLYRELSGKEGTGNPSLSYAYYSETNLESIDSGEENPCGDGGPLFGAEAISEKVGSVEGDCIESSDVIEVVGQKLDVVVYSLKGYNKSGIPGVFKMYSYRGFVVKVEFVKEGEDPNSLIDCTELSVE